MNERLVSRAEFAQWSREQKRQRGWLAGLRVWVRTNTGGRIIISRHWPHLLCWRWLLMWDRGGAGVPRRVGFSMWRYTDRPDLTAELHMGPLGIIRFTRQNDENMAALDVPHRPIVNWGAGVQTGGHTPDGSRQKA